MTPKDVVWTHRTTTLYRYRSTKRTYAVPVLLVFALIALAIPQMISDLPNSEPQRMAMYERFRSDPSSVSPNWQEFFADYRRRHGV